MADDGSGFPREVMEVGECSGHLGLAGMRERVHSLGGALELSGGAEGGATVRIVIPARRQS